MGLVRRLITEAPVPRSASFPGQRDGSRLWREAFGETKERGLAETETGPRSQASRIDTGTRAAVKRLIQSLSSLAPGGWSDDRYRQSQSLVGITYIAITHANNHLRRASFTVGYDDPDAEDGVRSVEKDSFAYKLVELLQNPNDDDSFGDLMAQWNTQLGLTGMGLTYAPPSALPAEMSRSLGGPGKVVPARLFVIPTAIAVPQATMNEEYPQGYYRVQQVYPYGPWSSLPTPTSSAGAPVDARHMIRFKYTHPLLRYDGYSPLTGLATWIDEFNMIDRSRHASMRGAINPSAVLSLPADENGTVQSLPEAEIERLIAEFESTMQGPDRMGQLYIAPGGSKLEPWGNTPDKMLYESGWDQLLSAILGGFGLTKPVAGMVEDSSYSTLFASLRQVYWVTLEPFCEMIAEKLTKFLAPLYGDNLVVKIRCKPIDDHEINFTKADKLVAGKAGTKNEYRKLIGLPPTKEEWGKDIAGDPSPYEKEQAEKQQQAAGGGAEQPGGTPAPGQGPPAPPPLGGGPKEETPEEARPDPPEVEESRPKAGAIAAGARGGPLKTQGKRLAAARAKPVLPLVGTKREQSLSVYEQITKALENGNGHAAND